MHGALRLRCLRRLWCCRSALSAAGAARCHSAVVDAVTAARAHRRQKDASKCGAEQAVDDEVARRVNDDQNVAELRVVEVKASTVAVGVLEQRPEDLVKQRRSLTNDEHAHDRNDTLCDVVVLATFAACTQLGRGCRHRRRRPPSDGIQRTDQLDVEVGEAGQRHQIHHRVVENVAVDDLVDLIVSEDQRLAGDRFNMCGVVAGDVADTLLPPNHLKYTTNITVTHGVS